ncbi:MAG: AsmA family protein [Pseudomonadales bacterium]|nr:AsmA family protein [Pseudomonadales bacterium]
MRALKFLGIFCLTLALVVATAVFWVTRNPEKFKPELTRIISANTGLNVEFAGDINWMFFPDFQLRLQNVKIDWPSPETPHIIINNLKLNVALRPLLNSNPQLIVSALDITDSSITYRTRDAHYAIQLEKLHVDNLAEKSSIQVNTQFQLSDGATTSDIALDFALALNPQTQSHQLNTLSLRIDDNLISGSAQLSLSDIPDFKFSLHADQLTWQAFNSESNPQQPLSLTASDSEYQNLTSIWDEEILPENFNTLINWQGTLQADSVISGEQTFRGLNINTEKRGDQTTLKFTLTEFLAGQATLNMSIDSKSQPYQWYFKHDIKDADTQQLLRWLEQNMQWTAPLLLSGNTLARGNTRRELIDQLQAQTSFDGQKGNLNISEIKKQILSVSRLTGGTKRVADWPDVLHYEQFTGTWNINGLLHKFNIQLDNLSVQGQGKYDAVKDDMDMRLQLVIHENPALNSFDVNAVLRDLSIPIRCKGSAESPRCKLDKKGVRKLLASALSGDSNNEINSTLEKKIEEEVPEEYRDTARALLRGLGDLLNDYAEQNQPEQNP